MGSGDLGPKALPSTARIVASVQPDAGVTEEQLERHYGPGYSERLYPCG